MKILFSLIYCFTLASYTVPVCADPSSQTYEFGVLPYLAPQRLEKVYQPIVNEFSRVLQRTVLLRTDTNSVDFFSKLAKKSYDIALVNPFDSIPAIDQFGYEPIAARPLHHCNIYTRVDSSITKVEQLKHKLLGVASLRSPITFYTKRILTDHTLTPGKDLRLKTYPTPQACLHALVIQAIDACGSSSASAANFKTARGIELRSLAKCAQFPGMVLLVHSRIPASEKHRLRKAVLNWPHTPQGEKHVRTAGPQVVFNAYDAAAYNNIRRDYQAWKKP
jgi:ABC-type phosphate/phosphonate transport system substrate-binding protein